MRRQSQEAQSRNLGPAYMAILVDWKQLTACFGRVSITCCSTSKAWMQLLPVRIISSAFHDTETRFSSDSSTIGLPRLETLQKRADNSSISCESCDLSRLGLIICSCCPLRNTESLLQIGHILHIVCTEPENMACTWFGEICSCCCLARRNKFHQTTCKPHFRAL